ncbi:MAG: DPP IV N-terminal domain-containing protein, partial [Verrucomicrobiales bacterium]
AISLAAPRATAQVEITIEGYSGVPLRLRALTGDSGPPATSVLERDLGRSGCFSPGSGKTAWLVAGSSTSGRIEGILSSPAGQEILRRSYRESNPARNAHRFADDIVEAITGKPGISSSQIVFVSNKTGSKELYHCDYDGGNLRMLTRDGSLSVSPAIDPAAKRVAYTSYRSGYPDVYLIELSSGRRSRIINAPGTNSGSAFSPDGSRIALSMSFSGNPEIYVTNTRGSGARRLTRSRGVAASPCWTPDGSRVVYVSDETGGPQLYEISASGGSPRRISAGYGYCTSPSVSPDGSKLAFNARIGGSMAVVLRDMRGGKSTVLTSGASAENPRWGADSRHLLYTKNGNLYLHNIESGAVHTVVSGMGRISEPSWSLE